MGYEDARIYSKNRMDLLQGLWKTRGRLVIYGVASQLLQIPNLGIRSIFLSGGAGMGGKLVLGRGSGG